MPRWRSALTFAPTLSAQSTIRRLAPVSSSNFARTAVCTFSYTRGTLGSTVGRTSSNASAVRSGSGRNAIV